jgi:hypothetical protein
MKAPGNIYKLFEARAIEQAGLHTDFILFDPAINC